MGSRDRVGLVLLSWLLAAGLAHGQPAHPVLRFKIAGSPRAVAFVADGKLLAVAGEEGRLSLWDAAGREVRALGLPAGEIDALLPLPGGGMLVSGGKEPVLHAWDVAEGRLVGALSGHQGPVAALALIDRGRRFVSTSYDRTLRVWEPGSWKRVTSLSLDAGAEPLLATALEGSTVAVVGSLEQTDIRLLDAGTGRDLRRLRYHPVGISALAMTPDGETVVSAGRDRVVRFWETASGRERAAIRGEPAAQVRLAMSPDGHTLAAAAPAEVTLWETASARLRLRLGQVPASVPRALAFDARGRRLAAGVSEGTVAVWSLAAGPGGPLGEKDLAGLWADLGGDDAARAYQAILRLSSSANEAVPFLAERLRAAAGQDAQRISRLVRQLDDDEFAVREEATRELERIGKGAEQALRKALEGDPSAELRRRAEMLLQKSDAAGPPALTLRDLRAVEVLEACGTPGARKVLETLATGAAAEKLTAEARASLRRLTGSR